MITKLCIQGKFLTENDINAINATRYLAYKSVDDSASLAKINAPIRISRKVFDAKTMASWGDRLKASPANFAAWWWQQTAADRAACPGALFEVVNEYSPPDMPGQFAAFEINCMQLADLAGVTLVIGNIGDGLPADFNWWKGYHPALDYARTHGHKFGYHGYYGIKDKQPVRVDWNLDRLEIVRQAYPGIFDGLDVYLTECGVDVVEDIHTPGWQTCLNAEEYLEQLTGFLNDLLNARPYIKATFLYIKQANSNYDVTPIMPRLAQFVNASNPVTGTSPGGIVEVEPPVPQHNNNVVTTTDGLRLRAGPSTQDRILTNLPKGTPLTLTGEQSGEFRQVSCWVHQNYIKGA